MRKRKHIESKVSIEVGYTQLMELRRFYKRGIRCALGRCDGRATPPEHRHVMLDVLNEAIGRLKILKARELIAYEKETKHAEK